MELYIHLFSWDGDFYSYAVYKEIQSVKGINHLEYKYYRLETVQLLTGFRYREQQREEQEELKQIPCKTLDWWERRKLSMAITVFHYVSILMHNICALAVIDTFMENSII